MQCSFASRASSARHHFRIDLTPSKQTARTSAQVCMRAGALTSKRGRMFVFSCVRVRVRDSGGLWLGQWRTHTHTHRVDTTGLIGNFSSINTRRASLLFLWAETLHTYASHPRGSRIASWWPRGAVCARRFAQPITHRGHKCLPARDQCWRRRCCPSRQAVKESRYHLALCYTGALWKLMILFLLIREHRRFEAASALPFCVKAFLGSQPHVARRAGKLVRIISERFVRHRH